MNAMLALIAGSGVLTIVTGILFVSVLSHGWALTLLWNWYMVPFAHAPVLSIPMGIGLSACIATILGQRGLHGPHDPEEKWWGRVIGPIARPWVAVLVGWIARWWL